MAATATSAQTGWESIFLQAIGAPVTPTNVAILDAWDKSEGTLGSNNPLAISGNHPGATSCIAQCGSSSPIMAYATIQQGTLANAQFLLNNNYAAVVKAFQNPSADPATQIQQVWAAINQSGWCKGCQGGKYPEFLLSLNPAAAGATLVNDVQGVVDKALAIVPSSANPTGNPSGIWFINGTQFTGTPNYTGGTPPSTATDGQTWFNPTQGLFYYSTKAGGWLDAVPPNIENNISAQGGVTQNNDGTLGIGNPLSAVDAFYKAIEDFLSIITSAVFWQRVALLIGGLILFAVGAIIIVSQSKTAGQAESAVTSAAL